MPELPEVETVASQLAGILPGRKVRGLDLWDPKLAPAARDDLIGCQIASVFRIGKEVCLQFRPFRKGRKPFFLAIHLRMSGRLIWIPGRSTTPQSHDRAALRLMGGAVHFVDPRRFGTFRWLGVDEITRSSAGLDPTSAEFSPERLQTLLAGSPQPIKTWLLRQDRLVGLGNIYASEILHAAQISPFREAGSLDPAETRRLHRFTVKILAQAIENCGTTFSAFQDAHGLIGNYGRFLKVYEREGQPCPRCGAEIIRVVQAQRSTYFCPHCVQEPAGPTESGKPRGRKKGRPGTTPA